MHNVAPMVSFVCGKYLFFSSFLVSKKSVPLDWPIGGVGVDDEEARITVQSGDIRDATRHIERINARSRNSE
jgi:hypothetical protein